jgi:hypothetical protein
MIVCPETGRAGEVMVRRVAPAPIVAPLTTAGPSGRGRCESRSGRATLRTSRDVLQGDARRRQKEREESSSRLAVLSAVAEGMCAWELHQEETTVRRGRTGGGGRR